MPVWIINMSRLPTKPTPELLRPLEIIPNLSRPFLETFLEKYAKVGGRFGPTEEPAIQIYTHLLNSQDAIRKRLETDFTLSTTLNPGEEGLLGKMGQLYSFLKTGDTEFLSQARYRR